MIGARDMAFPRLNMLSWWLLVFGGVVLYASIFFSAPEAGWTAYAPLSNATFMPGPRNRRVDPLAPPHRALLDPRRDQLHRHDPQHARARHVAQPHAAVRLDDPHLLVHDHPRALVVRGDARDAADRPQLQRHVLRPDTGRRAASVAAPVLVHGPPRGLHHGAARLRDGERDRPGVRAKADLRLPRDRDRDRGDRVPRHARLGAPHVRDAARRPRCSASSCCRRSRSRCRPGSRSSTGSRRCGAGTSSSACRSCSRSG